MDNEGINSLRARTRGKSSTDINGGKQNKYCGTNGIQGTTMSIENVRERMQRLRQDVVNQVGEQLNDMVTEVVEGIEMIANAKNIENSITNKNIYIDKKKPAKSGILPEKIFETRNSILTDLFAEVKHMKTIYNAFAAMLIILMLNTAAHDILDSGTLKLGFTTIQAGFGKFTSVIQIWLMMTASCGCVYVVTYFWAQQRIQIHPKTLQVKVWDYTWLIIFIAYQISFIGVPARIIYQADFPPPSSFILLMEQVRMLMKIHAFVRSIVPTITSYKLHATDEECPFPGFSKFLYFMFAPTIVYRDSYPRTKEIKWQLVAWHFFEVILVVFYVAFLFERFVIPVYKEFGLEPLNLRAFILRTFSTTMPGIIIFVCGFYCLLHAWMNTFAELLRFGDRLFYKDWWTSTSFDAFYRNWNVVVHDWLYTYIYKDISEHVLPKRKFLATFCVFFISALFHEYILSLGFRLFYPALFLLFGIVGFPLVFIKRCTNSTSGNIFLWFSLCTGSGLLVSFYAMEYFARINCPVIHDEILDLFIPRSWFCYTSYDGIETIN